MPHPLHMFYGNLAQLGKKSNLVIRSRSVMVKNWCNSISMEGVTVCGHHPECRVTFERGGPHIVWLDPRTDHRNSLNVPSRSLFCTCLFYILLSREEICVTEKTINSWCEDNGHPPYRNSKCWISIAF